MAVYAIGDIQGCHAPLIRLLDKIRFDPASDRLWLTGDLVNRGPDSLGVLRFVRSLGISAISVLGNHDLHLLAVDAGVAQAKRRDTLEAVLAAPDRQELIDWLRHRPLAIHDAASGILMVHAGLAPQWNLEKTLACAAEVEQVLRGDGYRDFLAEMYGNRPRAWRDDLTGAARLRCIVNCLTRMRYCDANGEMKLSAKGAPGSQPKGFTPWFRVPGRASEAQRVVFGHWSTLGTVDDHNVISMDTGCIWGGRLTAQQLVPAGPRTHVRCGEAKSVPHG